MMEEESQRHEPAEPCGCLSAPRQFLSDEKGLGMDESFAEVSLLVCQVCGRRWLRYFYEVEAFSASGRWYLGALDAEQAERVTAANAKAMLESLSWYFYGGSYYGGKSGRTSGRISLNP